MATSPKSRAPRKRRLPPMSINKMIPNILTLLALASGLTSMRYALNGLWEFSILAIAAAAVFDTLDGRVARMLKGASKFGAELDSLSDFVSFGVAPAMILYLWAMQGAGRPGWIVVMLFAMCIGLRLARFNVALEDENAPPWKVNFFTGVPAPASAGLVLLPLVLSFTLGDDFLRTPWTVGVFLIGVGGLAVSAIPTYSFKKVKVERQWVLPTMLIVAGLAAFLVSVPWITLSGILIVYACSIPLSFHTHRKLVEKTENNGSA